VVNRACVKRFYEKQKATTTRVPLDKLQELSTKCDELANVTSYLHNLQEEVQDMPPIDKALEMLDLLICAYEENRGLVNERLATEEGDDNRISLLLDEQT
jgi:hypothetical protein